MSTVTPRTLPVRVGASAAETGRAAARDAGDALRAALADHDTARLVLASAPSQQTMLTALVGEPDIDWTRVHLFHMDEYVGLALDHPQAFGQWLADQFESVPLGRFDRIDTTADPEIESTRYATLLGEAPIDLCCMGIGVNGHLAFNEPGDTDFADPQVVRRVILTEQSRQQQVDDECFTSLDEVPTHALSLSVPALLAAEVVVCTVIGRHKAPTVARAVEGPLTEDCPASALRTHARAVLHVDAGAGAELAATQS